jgi:hypothetical protein
MESMWSHICKKCRSRDVRIANWYENCKLILKLQTHVKIANVHVGTIHKKVSIANWCENCKLIWELQTDMKIAKQLSRFGEWFLRWRLQFSHERHSGIESLFWKRIFQFDCGVDDKNSYGTISRITNHDSYFNTNSCEKTVWFIF